MNIKEQTFNSMKWTSIEKFLVMGVQFIIGVILARLLQPSDFGTVGMLGLFVAVSNLFIDGGFSQAIIRKLDRTETDFSTVFYFNFIIALICYVILFIIAPWVADFFDIPLLCPILRIQSINLLLNSLMIVQTAKITINLNFKFLALRSLLSITVSGVIGIILAYKGFGVWALVIQGLLSTLISLIITCYYCKWIPKLCFSFASFKELGSFGSKLLASGVINTVCSEMTTIVIGKFFSAKDLGFYNRGTSLASLPINTYNTVLGRVFFPIMVNFQNEKERLITVYRKNICMSSIVVFGGCLLLAANAKPIVLLLFTEKWASAIIYLQVFVFSAMFDHINTLNLNLLQIQGRSDLFLKLEIIKKSISILFLFAAIPYGVLAICISKVIYTQIAIVLNTFYTGKLFNVGYYSQTKDYLPYFFYAVLASIPAFLLNLYDVNIIVGLTVGIFSFVVLYYLFLKKDVYFKEMSEIIIQRLHI